MKFFFRVDIRGRCWAFIGLRFSAALQQPAPPPGTPAPHRCAGRIGARFPSCWQTSLYAIRVALPLAPCGTCRGCCPAIGNGPKIGPRLRGRVYKFGFWSCAAVARSIRKEDRTRGRGRARPPGPHPAISGAGFPARPQQAVTPALLQRGYKRGCNRIRRARRAPEKGNGETVPVFWRGEFLAPRPPTPLPLRDYNRPAGEKGAREPGELLVSSFV